MLSVLLLACKVDELVPLVVLVTASVVVPVLVLVLVPVVITEGAKNAIVEVRSAGGKPSSSCKYPPPTDSPLLHPDNDSATTANKMMIKLLGYAAAKLWACTA